MPSGQREEARSCFWSGDLRENVKEREREVVVVFSGIEIDSRTREIFYVLQYIYIYLFLKFLNFIAETSFTFLYT